jgi:hypothetical protein
MKEFTKRVKSGFLNDAVLMRQSGMPATHQKPLSLIIVSLSILSFLLLLAWLSNESVSSNSLNLITRLNLN